jgi:hypothetical protein
MIPRANFNWDEFNELAKLFAKESGYRVGFLRHGLHYLIWPLKYLPYPEDTLLTIARFWSFCIGVLGIYYMIFRIASTLKTRLFGFLAVFLTATFSTFFESSIQYRTDLFTTVFFLVGFFLVLRAGTGRPPWLIPSLLLGLAMFINPKSLYHFLILLISYGYYWCYSKAKKRYFFNTVGFAFAAMGTLIILLLLHHLFYDVSTSRIAGSVAGSAHVGFGRIHGWTTKSNFAVGAITKGFFPSACILTGLVLGIHYFISNLGSPKGTSVITIAALFQVLTVLIHQGVYKYYIINILPLLAILGAIPLHRIILTILDYREKGMKGSNIGISYCILVLFIVGSLMGIMARLHINLRNTALNQRLHIKYLHQMFPSNIPYVDGFGLLSKYNNTLQWVSTKSLILYHRRGMASFEKRFSRNFPILIIESHKFSVSTLLPEDQEFIRNNFVPYFGQKFWIYGFRIKADMLRKGAIVNLKVKGPYSIEGAPQDLLIDGRPAKTPLYLEAGPHTLECQQGYGDISLTYGENSIDQVIPNFTLQPNSSGVIEIETPGQYYLSKSFPSMTTDLVMIDSSPVIGSKLLETQTSLHLDAGEHTYSNPLDSPVTFHLIGPLFVREIHRS